MHKVQSSILQFGSTSKKQSKEQQVSEESDSQFQNQQQDTEEQVKTTDSVPKSVPTGVDTSRLYENHNGVSLLFEELELLKKTVKPIPIKKRIYETASSQRTRSVTFCTNSIIIKNIKYECTYSRRSERYDEDHDCFQYLKAEKQPQMEIQSYFGPQIAGLDINNLNLLQHLCLTGAQLHYSTQSLCTPNVRNLMIRIYKDCQQHPQANAEKMIPKVYPQIVRNTHILLSEKVRVANLELARKCGPVSVALDAGTTKMSHYLTIMIQNTRMGTRPFEYKSIEMIENDADAYKKIGKEIVDSLKEKIYKLLVS